MSDDGVCEVCPVAGCEDCTIHANSSATCNSCGNGKQLVGDVCVCTGENKQLEYGRCECIEGYRLLNDTCTACQL